MDETGNITFTFLEDGTIHLSGTGFININGEQIAITDFADVINSLLQVYFQYIRPGTITPPNE